MPLSSTVPDYIHDSVRALPVLPTAATRLLEITREIDVDFREIVHVIESDQTLMARTLRAANSPLYTVSRRVKTVQQATVLLGTDAILNLALGISVMSFQSGLHKHLPIDAAEYGRHSVAVALAARQMAGRFKLPNLGEAFVAGLLHDIGKLVLLMHFGEQYARLMVVAQEGQAPLHHLEQDAFDLDHALVGHALCLHWNLPTPLAQAVAEHHTETAPRSLADVVSRANDLIKAVALGNGGNRFVALASDPAQPRDELGHDWLHELVLILPQETQHAEDALGSGEAETSDSEMEETGPSVQVQLNNPQEQELMLAVLWSMGYTPIDPFDALAAGNELSEPTALITDLPLSPVHRQVYAQHDVPVLEYGTWRANQLEAHFIDVIGLRTWIGQHLHTEIGLD